MTLSDDEGRPELALPSQSNTEPDPSGPQVQVVISMFFLPRKSSVLALTILSCMITGCSVTKAATTNHMDIDLSQFENNHDSSWPYLDARIATEQECPQVHCIQAAKNQWITILKFDSTDQAKSYATQCDCQTMDVLAVRFDGQKVSPATRAEIMNSLGQINADSPD